ncbi:hypothetical protein [Labedaea rhizosphaerae]|uniref:Uncharacterized protein n=1 Tax=Labedaea rhizosphaerae TaxID=598644 RepID=A0A4R6SIU3_LABRH|nr:hypothetical protein [Labedaea rhizosphaerae]TDQ04216.1 hypothetical protein EV186_101158 [Labedaea rhizosphaerae]
MSAPQPPNQPWQGGQPNQEQQPQGGPPSGPNPAISNPGPTQVMGGPGGPPADEGADRTQVVQPGQHGQHGQQGQGDATQMVPPGTMPPQTPPYAPPPSASDQSGGFGQPQHGGFGQQPPQQGGFGQQPGGFGQQPPPQQGGFGQQPPPGYGQPQHGGFAQQQGLSQGPNFGGQGNNTQMIAWAIAGLVALLGLVTAIWELSDDIFSGDVSDYASAVGNLPDEAKVASPGLVWISTLLILLGGLAAIGAGVLIYLKHKLAANAAIAAGAVMFIGAILYMIAFGQFEGDTSDAPLGNVKVWALIAGLLVAGAGALGYFPQTKQYLGIGSSLGGPGGGFGGGSGGGFGGGQPGGFGQQQPPQQGFGQQPPQQQGGFGGPPSGGFGQPPQQGGYGQQPPQQGGFGGPPPGQPGGQPGGQPPQQW